MVGFNIDSRCDDVTYICNARSECRAYRVVVGPNRLLCIFGGKRQRNHGDTICRCLPWPIPMFTIEYMGR